MSTLSEPQFVWAVVDVFVDQLSVPPVVAQTVGSQQHKQRPTQLPCRQQPPVVAAAVDVRRYLCSTRGNVLNRASSIFFHANGALQTTMFKEHGNWELRADRTMQLVFGRCIHIAALH